MDMHIRPSAAIRHHYNEIAELCKITGEPVYLTKNGERTLVVMDIISFTRREKMFKLREELLCLQEDSAQSVPDFTIAISFSDNTITHLSNHR